MNKKVLIGAIVSIVVVGVVAFIMMQPAIEEAMPMFDEARDSTIAGEMRGLSTRAAMIEALYADFNRADRIVNCAATDRDPEIGISCDRILGNSPATTIASYNTAAEYCVQIQLNRDGYLCVDHTGFSGEVAGPQCAAGQIRCRP